MSEVEERNGFSFLWKVENFSHCVQKRNELLESPLFTVEDLSSSEWNLLLYPRGTENENKIAIYLQRKQSDLEPLAITVDFELSLLTKNGTVLKMAELNEHVFESGDGYGIPTFVDRDDVIDVERGDYLPEDTLTVRCRLWKSKSSFEDDGKCSATTRICVEKGTFKWAISDFGNLQANRKKTLVVERASDTPLSLALYLSAGYPDDKKVVIDITLIKILRPTLGTCTVSVLDSNGRRLTSSFDERWLEATEDQQVWKLNPFIKRSHLVSKKHLYLPQDTLTLQFDFCLSGDIEQGDVEYAARPAAPFPVQEQLPPVQLLDASTQSNSNPKHFSMDAVCMRPGATSLRDTSEYSPSFMHDLHCMYEDRMLCDFVLRAGAEMFPVHKCVLGARSPVFRAMFSNEMAEGGSGEDALMPLDIPDLDADTMHALLTFIYTDGVEGLSWEGAVKLYFAADKYAVHSLRDRCAATLVHELTPANVARVLTLADMHGDAGLKRAACDYVMRNGTRVVRTAEWRVLECENLELAYETVREVCVMGVKVDGNVGSEHT